VAGGLGDLRGLAGLWPLGRRRRIAHEDADRDVAVDEDERQGVGAGIARTEHDAPLFDPLSFQETVEHWLGPLDEVHEVDRLGDDVIVRLVDDQPGFEVVDVVVVEKIVLFAEVHDDAGHVRFRQHGLEHLVDEAVPVLAAEQPWNDRFLRQLLPAFGAVVFERQDEWAGVVTLGPLPQRRQVHAVRPVAARVDEAVLALVGDEEFALADIGFHRDERLRHRLIGEAPGQNPQILVLRITRRLLRCTTRYSEQRQQWHQKSASDHHDPPLLTWIAAFSRKWRPPSRNCDRLLRTAGYLRIYLAVGLVVESPRMKQRIQHREQQQQ